MTHADLRIETITVAKHHTELSALLDSAFQVKNYVASFPQIFSGDSPATIFAAFNSKRQIVATCAVDTEIWVEPDFLRGACIGSVAVDPGYQKQGIGRRLLNAVVDELKQTSRFDFSYLFSEQNSFYQSIGFETAGIETLFSFRRVLKFTSAPEFVFRQPRRTSELTEMEKIRLWAALERGRMAGENVVAWQKWRKIASIPDMFVCWCEDAGGFVRAGAFIGKGIDFSGVMHSFFADSNDALCGFIARCSLFFDEQGISPQVAAGLWSNSLSHVLSAQKTQPLCMALGFYADTRTIVSFFEQRAMYPRALLSS